METGMSIAKLLTGFTIALSSISAMAHFQVLLSENDYCENPAELKLKLIFTHPMEGGPLMDMAEPKQFFVISEGKRIDLLKSLKTEKIKNSATYSSVFKADKPGDLIFGVEPAPYWEPAENKYIIHYTKYIVGVMGGEEAWDSSVGFPVEIEPLVRPYGLYAGNVFRGIVKKDGKPVPFAEIEVEYYNQGGKLKAPTEAHITQVIKADASGVFSYGIPKAGFWSFAALVDGPKAKSPDGKEADTELGALIWIKAYDMDK